MSPFIPYDLAYRGEKEILCRFGFFFYFVVFFLLL